MSFGRVIVLNQDYSFLNVCSVQRAISLVYQGKAEIVKAADRIMKNFENTWTIARPLVIRIFKLIRQIFSKSVPYSKSNIITRDGVCMYCGSDENLTVDHVIPKSKGGKSTWENCVAACQKCNNKKGDKTPSEAKMFFKNNKQPIIPTVNEFIKIKMKMYDLDKILNSIFI